MELFDLTSKGSAKVEQLLQGKDHEAKLKLHETVHPESRFSADELERYYQASRQQAQGANPNPNFGSNPTPTPTPNPNPATNLPPAASTFPANAPTTTGMTPPNPSLTNPTPVTPPKPQKSHRGIVVAVLILLGIVLVAGLAYLMINVIGRTPAVSGTRTVMVYMLGGDLESSEGMASADLAEMQAASVGNDTHVVVYTAGAKTWQTTGVTNNAVYEVGNGSLTQKTTLGSANAATAATLSDFIEYTLANYRSDLYDLIIWGRAGGATYGLGTDENAVANTTLTLADIATALSDNQFGASRTLEFIGFDAPLMGSIETAVALKDYSHYLVASEDLLPETGWNYNYLTQITRSTASADLVKIIVEQFANGLDASTYSEQFWTLSAVDLRLITDFTEASDPLFADLAAALSWDNYSQFASAVAQSTIFGYDGSSSYDFVDLQTLLAAIADTNLEGAAAATEASSILVKTVVANAGNVTNARGLSTYFISFNKPTTNAGLTRANAVSWSSAYADFLAAYARFASGSKQVAPGGFVGSNVTQTTDTLSLQMPADLAANYERAKLTVWERLDSNRYVQVFETGDITRDANTLTATNFRYQWQASDPMSSGGLQATEIRRDEGAVYYAVPVALSGFAANSMTTQNAIAIYKVVEGDHTARLVDLRLPAVSGLASKGGINLGNWANLNFNINAYYLLTDANNLETPAATHESWGTASSTLLHLDREHSVALVPLTADGAYFAQFAVTDTQGDVHYSQLIPLN